MALCGAREKRPLSIEAKSKIPGMNWKTTISAANPRKRMSRNTLPLASLPVAARAGATEASVTSIAHNMVLMASSFLSFVCGV